MTSATDNRTTELREKLDKLIIELDRLDVTLDSPASDMTLGEYEQEREKLLDGFMQAIAATLGKEKAGKKSPPKGGPGPCGQPSDDIIHDAATLGRPIWRNSYDQQRYDQWYDSLFHGEPSSFKELIEDVIWTTETVDLGPNGNECQGVDEGEVNTERLIEEWVNRAATLGNPEIVRCSDCKWCIQANPATGWNDVCDATDSKVVPDGYCAWGERRDDAE